MLLLKPLRVSALLAGDYQLTQSRVLLVHQVVLLPTFLLSPPSIVGTTAMARRTMSARSGTGGLLPQAIVRIVTSCTTTPVAYIPATTTVGTSGTRYGVSVLASRHFLLALRAPALSVPPPEQIILFKSNLAR
ncbi:hypothetical protein IJ076_00005, partial [Candidatus Saccharibacteria bacterium]|nr:hypothetical protein [Candidatus Saccharibacteria bacterium]